MLKIRVLTALVILPLTLAVVFLAPPWAFRLVVAVLLLGGCWEFRRIAGLSARAGWALFGSQLVILAGLAGTWPLAAASWRWALAAGCVAWLLLFTRLLGFREDASPTPAYRRSSAVSALVATTFCAYALFWLRDQPRGEVVVFLFFLLIWASDVGAYFAGRFLGRHRLAASISPKKTWEGVYGGMLLAVAAAFLLTNVAGLDWPGAALVVMSILTTLASVGGDLFISIHKRTVRLKDTGTLFPGHGGILDRYDSLLAGAPFFALAYGMLAS